MTIKTKRANKRSVQSSNATKLARRPAPLKQAVGPAKPGQAGAKHSVPPPPPVQPAAANKKRAIEALLRGPEGVELAELMAATGWQAHSVRAALTGFRKAGCTIERDRDGGATRYRIVEAP